MNIYEKMLAIATEAKNIEKNLKINMGAGSYNAVGEADVLAEIKPLETKYRVYGYPYNREIVAQEKIEVADKNGNIRVRWWLRVKTTYRFVNIEKPEEYVEVTGYGDGIDDGDKAPGKAITYSDKYCLLKAFQCVTGDDPDQTASEPTYKPSYTPRPQAAGEPMASQKQKDLIARMCTEKGVPLNQFTHTPVDSLTQREASSVIDQLFKLPKPEKQETNYDYPDPPLPF